MEHYKIDDLDNSIEQDLKNLKEKLYAVIDLRLNNNSNKIKESVIISLDKIKTEIENSKVINKINCLIQNKKCLEFKNTFDKPLNEVVQMFKEQQEIIWDKYIYRMNRYDYNDEIIQKRDLSVLDSKINLHANRDVLKSLEDKDRTIESIKKQSQLDLQAWTQAKELFYSEKYKHDMSKAVEEAKSKVQNIQKELEFTHAYSNKEKLEMKKEIRDLTFKLFDSVAQNKRLAKELEQKSKHDDQNKLLPNLSRSIFENDNTINFDWSDADSILKILENQDQEVTNMTITSFQNLNPYILEKLFEFVSTKITDNCESLKIEADDNAKYDLSQSYQLLELLLAKVSKSITLQGFIVDSNLLTKVFELSAKSSKLSLRNCVIDVGNDFKIDQSLDFKISELELIGINPKIDEESKNNASRLIAALHSCSLSNSIKKITLSQSNSFCRALWKTISSEFKDEVEISVTSDPWFLAAFCKSFNKNLHI